MTSTNIEEFLKFLREAESIANMNQSIVDDCNGKMQDIVHYFEFHSDAPKRAKNKLAEQISPIRQERRKAKDLLSVYEPVVAWVREHRKTISELEQLLGTVRKIERAHENRAYAYRSHIIEEILGGCCDGVKGQKS